MLNITIGSDLLVSSKLYNARSESSLGNNDGCSGIDVTLTTISKIKNGGCGTSIQLDFESQEQNDGSVYLISSNGTRYNEFTIEFINGDVYSTLCDQSCEIHANSKKICLNVEGGLHAQC